jgi:hypothetical protein
MFTQHLILVLLAVVISVLGQAPFLAVTSSIPYFNKDVQYGVLKNTTSGDLQPIVKLGQSVNIYPGQCAYNSKKNEYYFTSQNDKEEWVSELYVIDSITGKTKTKIHTPKMTALEIDLETNLLHTVANHDTTWAYGTIDPAFRNFTQKLVFPEEISPLMGISTFSKQNHRFFFASVYEGFTLFGIDILNSKIVTNVTLPGYISAIEYDSTQDKLYALYVQDAITQVVEINLQTGKIDKVVVEISLNYNVFATYLDANNNVLYISAKDSNLAPNIITLDIKTAKYSVSAVLPFTLHCMEK